MKRKEITQDDRVLRHLRENKGITSWEAIREYGITRLSACIFRLRREGYYIKNEWIYTHNRYNEPVKFVCYKLEEEPLKKEPWWKTIRFFM